MKDFRATIRQDSERAQAWQEVFGSHEVTLRSPFTTAASAPGVEVGLFYELDLRELTPEQRTRLIAHLAREFAIDEQEVAETLDEVGCPILAEDVIVTVYNPLKWT